MRVAVRWWRGKKAPLIDVGVGDFGKKIGGWGWFCAFGLEKWEKCGLCDKKSDNLIGF